MWWVVFTLQTELSSFILTPPPTLQHQYSVCCPILYELDFSISSRIQHEPLSPVMEWNKVINTHATGTIRPCKRPGRLLEMSTWKVIQLPSQFLCASGLVWDVCFFLVKYLFNIHCSMKTIHTWMCDVIEKWSCLYKFLHINRS